jgi:hypothetical protein
MSMKNTSLKTLIEDIKASYVFAFKNLISFIIAMIGVAFVTVLLIAVSGVIVGVVLYIAVGTDALIAFFVSLAPLLSASDPSMIIVVILLLVVPIVAPPLMVSIGALYGMGREIVESDGTSAEGVFIWYKNKFFSLAGGGIVLFLVILAPLFISLLFMSEWLFMTPDPATWGFLSLVPIGYMVYVFVTSGLLSMVPPAIIDGYSVAGAIKLSVKLGRQYFDRVFSVWAAFTGIALLLLSPVVIIPLLFLSAADFVTFGLYTVGIFLFLFFIHLPALVIGTTRTYMILVGDEGPVEGSADQHDISFIGGA